MRGVLQGVQASAVHLAERALLPEPVVVAGIRRLLRGRLAALDGSATRDAEPGRPEDRVAVATEAANRQHYEVPVEFFRLVLGPHLKYSCCLWEDRARTLAEAERRMIDRTAARAGLSAGQRILDLGCGWGSLSLDVAAAFPDSRVLAVSNSASQIAFVRAEGERRGLTNLEARRANVNDFDPGEAFDRILSVEMMEHVRNHAELMRRIDRWLAPDGRVFAHVFRHRAREYTFEDQAAGDWMARHFFTGGIMPSPRTLPEAAGTAGLAVEDRWDVSGTEYARTAQAWIDNLDRHREAAQAALAAAGESDPRLALARWRLFFLAVRETFAYRAGREWLVSHYRFRREDPA